MTENPFELIVRQAIQQSDARIQSILDREAEKQKQAAHHVQQKIAWHLEKVLGINQQTIPELEYIVSEADGWASAHIGEVEFVWHEGHGDQDDQFCALRPDPMDDAPGIWKKSYDLKSVTDFGDFMRPDHYRFQYQSRPHQEEAVEEQKPPTAEEQFDAVACFSVYPVGPNDVAGITLRTWLFGQVLNGMTSSFEEGKSAEFYVNRADQIAAKGIELIASWIRDDPAKGRQHELAPSVASVFPERDWRDWRDRNRTWKTTWM